MQTTPTNYRNIIAGSHYFETKIKINGNEVPGTDVLNIRRTQRGMPENKPTVGGALSAMLDLKIIKPSFSIPKMAGIAVFVRVCNTSSQSDWIPKGTFFIDTRAESQADRDRQTLTITAYDAMMKAEADYPNTDHDWPYLDKSVVAEIASAIGVTVDARTNQFLTSSYMINLPSDYTMRETLEHIAAAYGGNFVITSGGTEANPQNKLLFVPLYGFDYAESGFYLADENGNALTFGNEGWYLLA